MSETISKATGNDFQNQANQKNGTVGCVILIFVVIFGFAIYSSIKSGKNSSMTTSSSYSTSTKVDYSTMSKEDKAKIRALRVLESERVYDSIAKAIKAMPPSKKESKSKEPQSEFSKKMAIERGNFLVSIKKEFALKGFAVTLKTTSDRDNPDLIITHPFFTDVSFYQLQKWVDLKMGYSLFNKIYITDGENYKSADLKGS